MGEDRNKQLEKAMAITLPYNFDTSNIWQNILKMGSCLVGVIAAGILYSLVLRHFAAVLHLSLSGALLLWFGWIFFKHSDGAVGTITKDRVVVRPGELYGRRLPGPLGEFALRRFTSIRVEHVSAPTSPDVRGGPHQRVYLIGDAETPSILIARAGGDSQVGPEIAGVLRLPCEEIRALY